ncbi:MAG: aldo/keto reductase [Saprospiraceae bacterium]|nr:aldo/keto reductase [Saprospiraceae bacterium]
MTTRRKFIRKASALTSAGLLTNWSLMATDRDQIGAVLPKRQLTRDGAMVTAFCLGGYHLGITEDPKYAEKMVERSLELGVRFFDNARGYHRGRSEEYMGRFLTPKYRDQIFLMTKSPAKTADDARRHLDESLKALNTDQLDLWQIHALDTLEDIDNRLANGVLDVFLDAKEKGKTRYIGFTGHRNPKVHLHLLSILAERGIELDTCQMPLNVCDPSFESFQIHVLPELLKREYGILAMKTMSGGSMMGKRIDTTPASLATEDIPDMVSKAGFSFRELHQYVYSLPVSALVSGCDTIDKLDYNVSSLSDFKELSPAVMEELVARAKPFAGYNVENYKRILG